MSTTQNFNKMFIMLPVMLAARKLDSEDPMTVYYLRISYGVIQSICIAIVIYIFTIANKYKNNDTIVYIPAPPQPFQDPNNTKKKYTEIAYGHHVVSTARSLVGSTLFSICLTCGLHYYRGMVMGLAIQTIMAPLNLYENPLVKAIIFNKTTKTTTTTNSSNKDNTVTEPLLQPSKLIFQEKLSITELSENDEVVDEQGNPVVRTTGSAATNAISSSADGKDTTTNKQQSFEELMLDTWDRGAKADYTEFINTINKDNITTQTKADQWTPLMILAGLNCTSINKIITDNCTDDDTTTAEKVVTMIDRDGWNCLHWAAFHGGIDAAEALLASTSTYSQQLLTMKDKDDKTPIDIARVEKNDALVTMLEKFTESKKSK